MVTSKVGIEFEEGIVPEHICEVMSQRTKLETETEATLTENNKQTKVAMIVVCIILSVVVFFVEQRTFKTPKGIRNFL